MSPPSCSAADAETVGRAKEGRRHRVQGRKFGEGSQQKRARGAATERAAWGEDGWCGSRGPEKGQVEQAFILNRVITWIKEEGIRYEADPRHQETIIGELGLKDGKGSASPAAPATSKPSIVLQTAQFTTTFKNFGESENEILIGLRNQTVKVYDVQFRSFSQSMDTKVK